MSLILNEVSVTEKTSDILVVDILNQKLPYEPFEYIIYSIDNIILRRGQFRAPSVQLSTTHLHQGKYYLHLLHRGQEWHTTLFEKFAAKSVDVIN